MGSKDKTISFRVREERFEALKDVSEGLDPSLSEIFREFVTAFNNHNGRVQAIPKHEVPDDVSDDGFPARVSVSKSLVREHERLELEAEHLREELQEYHAYANKLEDKIEHAEQEQEDVVLLEDLDTLSAFSISTD